jgi:hypothetical protein
MAVKMAKSMEPIKELDEQGNPIVDDHSDDEEDEDDPPKTVKVGDKELTLDQIAELEKKSSAYDALLPEFTKKSQALSEFEKAKKPDEDDVPFYLKKDWEPKTFAELQAALKAARDDGAKGAIDMLEKRQKEVQDKVDSVKKSVDDFVADVRIKDKEFDDKDFFRYAAKHKYPIETIDQLRGVYSAYAELQDVASGLPKEKRHDRVNKPGSGEPTGPDLSDIRAKGGSIYDQAMEAFGRVSNKK